jgi:hypothetical protein
MMVKCPVIAKITGAQKGTPVVIQNGGKMFSKKKPAQSVRAQITKIGLNFYRIFTCHQ